jgi:molybdopterin/thiamine biosynthesis adenylyltransferase
MPLSEVQIERYSRQIILPEVGGRGQTRLLQSAVTVVGDGPLAYTVMLYLTAAGVGRITWCVSDGTLATGGQRLHDDLNDLNPDVHLRLERLDPTAEGAVPADPPSALIVVIPSDALTLAGANLRAIQQRVPLIVGLADGHMGWMAAFAERPCACCWAVTWPASTAVSDDPATGGVIGSLAALTGVQFLLGIGATRWGTVLQYDGSKSTMTESPVAARPGCSACAPASRTNA